MRHDGNNKYSSLPFGEALAALLRDYQANPYRVNFKAFAQELGMPYSTLMSMVTRGTIPSQEVMERAAVILGVHPTYFREYRTHLMEGAISRAMEAHPELAGKFFEFVMSEIAALDEHVEANANGQSLMEYFTHLENAITVFVSVWNGEEGASTDHFWDEWKAADSSMEQAVALVEEATP